MLNAFEFFCDVLLGCSGQLLGVIEKGELHSSISDLPSPEAQIFWFGQPAHPSLLPASSLFTPTHSWFAFVGTAFFSASISK